MRLRGHGFSDMPHVWRLLQLWDSFCYQTWTGLNDALWLSPGRFFCDESWCHRKLGWISVALSGLPIGPPLAHRYLWIFSGAWRLWGFQLLSHGNTLKTRLIWERTPQDVLQRLSQGSLATSQLSEMVDWLEMWMVADKAENVKYIQQVFIDSTTFKLFKKSHRWLSIQHLG